MPNIYDFSKLEDVKEIVVNPEGWIKPLTVEYGFGYHKEAMSYHWRVKGTQHTFVIPVGRLDYLTEGDYAKHFEEALEGFREDYKGWAEGGFESPWMQAYRTDFSKYISI
jgi:hypothetical protein